MKQWKKFVGVVVLGAVMAVSAVSMAACGGSTQNYVFEAENATLYGGAQAKKNVTDDGLNTKKYDASGVGCVEALSSSSATGAYVEWTINATKEGTATLTAVMASRYITEWTDEGITIGDLTLDGNISVTVNGEAIDLTGKTVTAPNPAKSNGKKCADGSDLDGQWWTDLQFGHTWRDIDLGSITLKEGANTIKITGIKQDEKVYSKFAPMVDCIKLDNVTTELSFTSINNFADED
jgi:hypothetical protein